MTGKFFEKMRCANDSYFEFRRELQQMRGHIRLFTSLKMAEGEREFVVGRCGNFFNQEQSTPVILGRLFFRLCFSILHDKIHHLVQI